MGEYQVRASEELRGLISAERLKKPLVLSPEEMAGDEGLRGKVLAQCEAILPQPIPELKFTDFAAFYQTGDRRKYEEPYFERRRNLGILTSGVLLGGREGFLHRLEDYLWEICSEATWVLPAHLPPELDYDVPYIDLFASTTAEQLGEIVDSIGERLHPNLLKRVKHQMYHRVLRPYVENPDRFHWANRFDSNWCAVCNGAIGAAALSARMPEPELSELCKFVLDRLNGYLGNFDEQGGWVEGVGYWNFGLTHLSRFADLLQRATEGKIDLFEHPTIQRTGSFLIHSYLGSGRFVPFGDVNPKVRPDVDLMKLLAGKTPYGRELAWILEEVRPRESLYPTLRDLRAVEMPTPRIPQEVSRHFEGIGWVMTRRSWEDKLGPVLAVKAGNNGEPHNQIDIGQVVFCAYGEPFLWDLGSGLYTRQYFREGRYSNPFCGPEGHSLIFIGGRSQGIGSECQGEIVRAEFSPEEDAIEIDLTKAYPPGLVKRVTREVRLVKNTPDGLLMIRDVVEAESPGEIESRFQVRGEPRVIDVREVRLVGERGNLCMRLEGPEGAHLKVGTLENLPSWEGPITTRYISALFPGGGSATFDLRFIPYRTEADLLGSARNTGRGE
ncbi:MAG: heparinase II/III domain-containing protein [bacterium]